jgi:hypothetical protein
MIELRFGRLRTEPAVDNGARPGDTAAVGLNAVEEV